MTRNSKWTVPAFLFPGLAGFTMFYLAPFVGGVYYSLVNNAFEKKFTGLANYVNMFESPVFILALKNTLIFTITSVPGILFLSMLLAVLVNYSSAGVSLFRRALVLPLAVPVASVVLVWKMLFDDMGYINHILRWTGLSSVHWLGTNAVRWPVILLYIWRNCGYNMILFLAALGNLPHEPFEAADLDGAGWWTKFRKLTIPLLFPSILFVTVISIINSFKIFKESYLLGGNYPPDSIYMVQHYINDQFQKLNYERLTSAAYIFAAIICIIVFFLFKAEDRFGRVNTL